jgi:hypothetical protein
MTRSMGPDTTSFARDLARRGATAAALAAGIALLHPAAGLAETHTLGSDLTRPASIEHAHQADTAFWTASEPGGGGAAVPSDGQIKAVRIKGMAVKRPDGRPAGAPGGETMFHVQAITGNAFRITSQALYLPNTGDAQQVTTFPLENFCAKAGDRIAFNTVGGFDAVGDQVTGPSLLSPYPMGTPLRIFASASGGTVDYYEQANGTDNGESMAANGTGPRAADQGFVHAGSLGGEELLMQMVVATGDDRSYECGGPNTYRPADPVKVPKAPVAQKTTIPSKQRVNVSRKGVAGLALFCQPGSGPCAGKVTIYATVRSKQVAIGTKVFSIGAKSTGKLQVKLSRAGFKLWQRSRRKLPVTIVAVTNPGTPDYQHSFKVTLRKVGSK